MVCCCLTQNWAVGADNKAEYFMQAVPYMKSDS
jgi:hypothetical protein